MHVHRRWSRFMILGLSSADGGMTIGLAGLGDGPPIDVLFAEVGDADPSGA